MELQERLRALRIKHELTQKELSQKLGVSSVSIGNWETGVKTPSIPAIVSLAKLYGVSTDYLLGVAFEQGISPLTKSEHTLLSGYRMLDSHGRKAVDTLCAIEKARIEAEQIKPVITGKVIDIKKKPNRYLPRYTTPSAAGYSVPLDGDDFEMILVDDSVPSDADFAVGIQGNSMYPYIHDGDTVFVKKDCELEIGDVGIFCVDGAMYCKQYYVDEYHNLILVSANPRLKNTNVFVANDSDTEVQCYGKVLLDSRIALPDYLFN